MIIYGIQQYRDIGWGESLFIIGNGSSINMTDLKQLPQGNTMTVNRSWQLFPARFHSIIMHSGYIRDIANMEKQPEVLFVAGSAAEVEAKYRMQLQNEVCFIARKTPKFEGTEPDKFIDLDEGWHPTHTGLFSIQVGIYLGYKNIFLIGFDGYGRHFEAGGANPIDDHARHKVELEFLCDSLHVLSEMPDKIALPNIYNLNPANAYNVFQKISIADAMDIYQGEI